jgi:hypothetical protein
MSKYIKPLAIDLFCGLGGWTEGLLMEGYDVVGFDIERHQYGNEKYPAQLVLQDVLTIHGKQFKNASLIVASPPCQAYSYRSMPWKRAKALPPPDNSPFEACFRIQREACEDAGRYIPMVVENVRGANKWVGKAKWHFGSFYLWGDVPALMPIIGKYKSSGMNWSDQTMRGQDFTRIAAQCTKLPVSRFDGSGKSVRSEGVKQPGIGGFRENGMGDAWFQDGAARHGSKSTARKRASAIIAKIPLTLSRHIARAYYPVKIYD